MNVCAYCSKHGHWQKDCRKKQADQQNQVRVVGATDNSDSKQDTQSTAASFSTGSGSQAVRLVCMHASQVGSAVVEDLTLHSCPASPTSPGSVRMLQVGLSDSFDMSVTDSDGAWTFDFRPLHATCQSSFKG